MSNFFSGLSARFDALVEATTTGCDACNDYLNQRLDVVGVHLLAKADVVGVDRAGLAAAYLQGVHDRHLSGLSLDAKPDPARKFREAFIYGRVSS